MDTRLEKLTKIYPYLVILSAEQAGLQDDINDRRSIEMANDIWRTHGSDSFLPALGTYHGKKENSYVVGCIDYFDVTRITNLGLHNYEQECVLVLDRDRDIAVLVSTASVHNIGTHLKLVTDQRTMHDLNIDSTVIDGVMYYLSPI